MQRFIWNTSKDVLPGFSEPFFVQPTILFILSSEFMSSFRLRISALFCAADIVFSSVAWLASMAEIIGNYGEILRYIKAERLRRDNTKPLNGSV